MAWTQARVKRRNPSDDSAGLGNVTLLGCWSYGMLAVEVGRALVFRFVYRGEGVVVENWTVG